jgi:hypothetical protein
MDTESLAGSKKPAILKRIMVQFESFQSWMEKNPHYKLNLYFQKFYGKCKRLPWVPD